MLRLVLLHLLQNVMYDFTCTLCKSLRCTIVHCPSAAWTVQRLTAPAFFSLVSASLKSRRCRLNIACLESFCSSADKHTNVSPRLEPCTVAYEACEAPKSTSTPLYDQLPKLIFGVVVLLETLKIPASNKACSGARRVSQLQVAVPG